MSNIKLTEEEKAILNHCSREGEVWASNATDAHVRGCIEEHRQSYLDAKAELGGDYKTAQQKQDDFDKGRLDDYNNASYSVQRSRKYPSIYDYLDGVVKNDQAQIDKYIADCKAVKDKYAKE